MLKAFRQKTNFFLFVNANGSVTVGEYQWEREDNSPMFCVWSYLKDLKTEMSEAPEGYRILFQGNLD